MRNVLVLCTGNSARSVLSEVLINELGAGRFRAFSAGSRPAGQVNPGAVKKLLAEGHSIEGLSSKTWDRFSEPGAPSIDVVITVCDNAAGESCPIFNGAPVTVHWGIPDPADFEEEQARDEAFDVAYARLRRRVEALLALPPGLEGEALRAALQGVHEQAGASELSTT